MANEDLTVEIPKYTINPCQGEPLGPSVPPRRAGLRRVALADGGLTALQPDDRPGARCLHPLHHRRLGWEMSSKSFNP